MKTQRTQRAISILASGSGSTGATFTGSFLVPTDSIIVASLISLSHINGAADGGLSYAYAWLGVGSQVPVAINANSGNQSTFDFLISAITYSLSASAPSATAQRFHQIPIEARTPITLSVVGGANVGSASFYANALVWLV